MPGRRQEFPLVSTWEIVRRARANVWFLRVVEAVLAAAAVLIVLFSFAAPPLLLLLLIPAIGHRDVVGARRNVAAAAAIKTEEGRVVLDAGVLEVTHPLLSAAARVDLDRVRCFDVDPDCPPHVHGLFAHPPTSFPIHREPGFTYEQRRPLHALSHGDRPSMPLAVVDQGGSFPNAIVLFAAPVPLTIAKRDPGLDVPHGRPAAVVEGRPVTLTGRTRHLQVEPQKIDAPGLYLRLADPVGFGAAMRAAGVREGLRYDDLPGVPPPVPRNPEL